MQQLSETYNTDISLLTFAAVKNLVTDAEWREIEQSINSFGAEVKK